MKQHAQNIIDLCNAGPIPGGISLKIKAEAEAILAGGWISVEDALPDMNCQISGRNFTFVIAQSQLGTSVYKYCDGVWSLNGFTREDMKVTHWMPLPEPPQ